jgi:hypothetical protein
MTRTGINNTSSANPRASALASRLVKRLVGKPADDLNLDDDLVWRIEVQDQDGTKPYYDSDQAQQLLTVYLHQGQLQAWQSDKRFVFMIAGKQGGKTTFGPLWLFEQIIKYGSGDYLAISATYDLFKLKMLPAIKQLFVEELGIARYWAGDQILEFAFPDGSFGATKSSEHEKMWARVILRSADSEKGLQSASAKAAWMDEPGLYPSTAWKDIRGRLALAQGPALGTTTPYGMNWLKTQIYDEWLKGSDELDVIQFSSAVSPFFPQEEYESLKKSMQSWEFRMDYDAQFGRPPGMIYEDFKDDYKESGGHKVKRFVVPNEWPRYVGIDPGEIHPAKLWLAHDPAEDVYYVYREQFGAKNAVDGIQQNDRAIEGRMTSKEHARADVLLAQSLNERVVKWAIGAKSEKYWRQDYTSAGARGVSEPDTADVWEGVDRVTLLLRQHRLYFFDDLTGVLSDIQTYSRKISNGVIVNEIENKSKYHYADALRYLAVMLVKSPKSSLVVRTHRSI